MTTTVTSALSFLSPCLKSKAITITTGRRHTHTTMATTMTMAMTTVITMTKTLQRPSRSTAGFSTSSATRTNNQNYSDPPLPPIDTSKRHKGIVMHPDSIGVHIMPGDVVFKKVRHAYWDVVVSFWGIWYFAFVSELYRLLNLRLTLSIY